MSVQATTWVWEHSKAENAGLLVMLAIADSANREGAAAMQSVPTIAKMSRTSDRHVARCIARLIEMGELERTGQSQRYGTIVYRLPGMGPDPKYRTPDLEVTPDNPSTPDIGEREPLTSGPSTPDTQVTQPQRTPQGTNPTSSSGDDGGELKRTQSTDAQRQAFERWWSIYPRKVGKIAAEKAFLKALKLVQFRELGEGLERAVADWSARETPADKIPHPSTWLNEGRWGDEHPAATPAAGSTGAVAEDDAAWMTRRGTQGERGSGGADA